MMPPFYYSDAWHVAALFDEAGNVVQWNTLLGDDTGFEQELITQETTNSEYQASTHDTLTLACSDYEGIDQLRSWELAKTSLQAVALSRDPSGRTCRWTVGTHLQELTDQAKAKRSDGDSYLKAILDGYDASVRQRNIIYGETGNSLILPLAGPTLTLSGEDLANAFTLTLTAKSFADVTLDSATANFSKERGSISLKLPADTWKVVWNLDTATNGALRADRKATYIAG